MDKLRVLAFSTAYLPIIGGAEVAVRELTERMQDVDVTLVCARLRRGLPSDERIGRVRVIRIGFGSSFDKYLLPFLGVLKALRLGSFDLVWSIMASYGGFASLIYTWFHPSVRLLLTLQEGDPPERYARRLGVLNFLQRRLFARADAIQAISHFLADWAKDSGAMVEPIVIPNGVDIELFRRRTSEGERVKLRTELGYKMDDVVLFSASRLSYKNGIDLILDALATLPTHIKLLLAGDGELRQDLERRAEINGVLHRVTFLEGRTHQQIAELLQAIDVFVRPSRSEGLGNSFLEAMAAGVPVIGTPVGGIPDFLKEGKTGWLAPVEDAEALAKVIDQELAMTASVREAIVQEAQKLVCSTNDWADLARRIQELMQQTVDTSRLIVATGIYPPEIGGPATVMKTMVETCRREGTLTRVFTYGSGEDRETGVTTSARGVPVLLRYLFFVGKLRSELRKGDQVYATDVFSVGIPTRLALMGRKNPLTIRLGGEWCWEDAVNQGAHVTLKEFWAQPDTLKRKLMRWNYRWILDRAERVTVTSELLKTTLERNSLVDKTINLVVKNNRSQETLPQIEAVPLQVPRFIYIGRFAPVKNVPFLARVLRKLAEKGVAFEMEFVGSGSEEPLVRRELAEMAHIRFFGSLPHEKVMKRLAMSHALLLPSLSDMNPNAAVEAMALGKPCFITQEHGLTPDPLLHELDPKDEDAWVEALLGFLRDHDKARSNPA